MTCPATAETETTYEYHTRQLHRHCRLCAKLIGTRGKKTTQYACSSKKMALMTIGIDVDKDSLQIHPKHLCNACNTKLSRATSTSSPEQKKMATYTWQPHSDPHCSVCDHFRHLGSGGRPAKSKGGRPKTSDASIHPSIDDTSVHESWGSIHQLTLDRFLPPQHNLCLEDLQCKKCMCIADRPVITACGSLLCYICTVQSLHQGEQCPACQALHSSVPYPGGKVVTAVIGSLLLHCISCGALVELQRLKEHQDSGCLAVPLTSSKVTLEQLLLRPVTAPLTADEKKLATSLVKRLTNTSPSAENILTLPTSGQVRVHNTQFSTTQQV